MNTLLKTSMAFSLAGLVMFSAAMPVLAQSNKDWAHQNAPGIMKKIDTVSTDAMTAANIPVAKNSASQPAATNQNGKQASQVFNQGKSQVVQHMKVANNSMVANQEVKSSNNQSNQSAALQGSNGTIKVGNYVLGGGPDGNPGNKPHLPCKFEIEAYGFDAGVTKVHYVTTSQAPTQPKSEVITSGSFNLDKDSSAFGGSDRGYDGKVVLDLSELLKKYSAHDKQGHHIKVEVTFNGQPSHAGKHKVFWVEKCVTNTNGGSTSPTPTPQDNGQVSSIKTDKPATGVLGTNIDRTGDNLPSTGGLGMALAQAAGMFLIVLGAAAAHVRRIQAKIIAQMSI